MCRYIYLKGGGIQFSGISDSPKYPLIDGISAKVRSQNISDDLTSLEGAKHDIGEGYENNKENKYITQEKRSRKWKLIKRISEGIGCRLKVRNDAEVKKQVLNVLSENDVQYTWKRLRWVIGEVGYEGKLDHTRVVIKFLISVTNGRFSLPHASCFLSYTFGVPNEAYQGNHVIALERYAHPETKKKATALLEQENTPINALEQPETETQELSDYNITKQDSETKKQDSQEVLEKNQEFVVSSELITYKLDNRLLIQMQQPVLMRHM
ncbi:hypothetical protein POM88_021072 [Heracleum sosnowskyi]|uniref:Uncharacterized protein n=1 Tax=Heracleum sosnowskyi TaxID=360622 RepID=A0AAD8IF45_9APIA|nr:hypothetical protein POM88_021072 [Heracleum sosnowskyi]